MEQNRYKKQLNANLRSIRLQKGLTTVDLAKILGVSQAKISYIEHNKGVLSAADIAVLSRRLNVPITEFFSGLIDGDSDSEEDQLVHHLVRLGAAALAKPLGNLPKPLPLEEVFARSLAFVEDDRFQKALCAALIAQAGGRQIKVDRIFASIGSNPFLIAKAADQIGLGLEALSRLPKRHEQLKRRAQRQLSRMSATAESLLQVSGLPAPLPAATDVVGEVVSFVEESLDAKR